MSTLYTKYRPKNFEETVNQNHIKITLQNEIQSGKIAHAYLFCGPRAVGKTTLARVFSKAINCEKRKDGEYEPCDKCESCENIRTGRSLDIIEIDAASHTGVDNVRENIIASARVAPSKSKNKVFIIDEVHMLSISAFNALLKIMEEPPASVVFILCTTEIHKVPTTIISRCQRFDFKRISVNDIVKKLQYIAKSENIKIDIKILEEIARQSEGHMRDAESLLGQVVSIGGQEITQEEADLVIPRSDLGEIINLLETLSKKDTAQGIKLVNNLIDSGVDLKTFTSDLIEILRKLMISKINPALSEKLALELGESLEIKLNNISKDIDINKIIKFINKFSEAKNKLKESFITQLPLELAIIELCLAQEQAQVNISQKIQETNPASAQPQAERSTQAKNTTSSYAELNKTEIKSKWSEVLVKIKKYNHSLSFVLRACEPRDVSGNQLCLAFKYKFHKDRIDNPEIKNIVENVLKEVYGQTMSIEALIDENLDIGGAVNVNNAPASFSVPVDPTESQVQNDENSQNLEASKNETPENNSAIDNILKTFGGKVVK